MGDRVRLIATAAPTTDPLGLVADWLTKAEYWANYYLVTNPSAPSVAQQVNYDGVSARLKISQLVASSNPSLSALLLSNAHDIMTECAAYSDIGELDPAAGVDGVDPRAGATGYGTYNLGPKLLVGHASTDAGDVALYKAITVNFARYSAVSKPLYWLYNAHYNSDTTWPSPTPHYGVPYDPPSSWTRDLALACIAHLVADDIYAAGDTRVYPASGTTYLAGHTALLPNYIDWYVGTAHAVDVWRDIAAQLAAVNGDFSQVTDTWRSNAHEFVPFMWAHVARALIYYYEDSLDDSYNVAILSAVTDLCDIMTDYCWTTTAAGRSAFLYDIGDGGTISTASLADLCLWIMPMFAWVYSKTLESKYYSTSVTLIQTGLAEAYWGWSKQFNQQTLWAYDGFQWLGWTSDSFGVPW